MSCTAFDISYVNISVLHLIVLILSHFQEISKKVRTEEQTATKEILQRIFPDIRIEDIKVKYNNFVFYIICLWFSMGVILGLSHSGRNISRRCLSVGC